LVLGFIGKLIKPMFKSTQKGRLLFLCRSFVMDVKKYFSGQGFDVASWVIPPPSDFLLFNIHSQKEDLEINVLIN
jgi:hypothetical protein